jgi:hypothetical protein
VEIVPGRAIAAVHCMEYRDTDIGPYNEVSLSVATVGGRECGFGPTPLFRSILSNLYPMFIVQLPVNTEPALYGGIDFFNFPKSLAEIGFEEREGRRTCTVRDLCSGELILQVEGEDVPTHGCSGKTMTMLTFSRIGDKILRARMTVNLLESGQSLVGKRMRLMCGSHPRSRDFQRLRSSHLFPYVFAPQCEAILFPPEVE